MVTILPKPPLSHDSDDTLTPAEARKVRHALKQVREGKTVPWSQVKPRGPTLHLSPCINAIRIYPRW